MVVLALFFLLLYFAPTVVALVRGIPDMERLVLLNLCFAWTGIGWVALVLWAWSVPGDAEHR